MEFFELDSETRSLTISPQIWIYFVVAVATTILAAIPWYLMAGLPHIHQRPQNNSGDALVPLSLQRGYIDVEKNTQC